VSVPHTNPQLVVFGKDFKTGEKNHVYIERYDGQGGDHMPEVHRAGLGNRQRFTAGGNGNWDVRVAEFHVAADGTPCVATSRIVLPTAVTGMRRNGETRTAGIRGFCTPRPTRRLRDRRGHHPTALLLRTDRKLQRL
jgi:hypothetical protein